jgi:hypothetical protein
MTISRRTFLHATGLVLAAPLYVKALGDPAQAGLTTPKYFVPFTDSNFGNKVVKVTDPYNPVPGLNMTWGRIARHHYSIDQAWNADQSLLILFKGSPGKLFLDGTTYQPLFALHNPGAIRWHRTNPDLMVCVGKKGVGYWDVRKHTLQVLNPLSGYSNADIGVNKGNLSDDGTMLAITATRSDGKKVIFAYDLVSGKKYPDIDMSGWYELGWTTISPLKRYIISYSAKISGDKKQRLILTLDGQLVQTWPEYERPGHSDFTVDGNGDEVAIGRSKYDDYKFITRRLVDSKVTLLSSRCKASHTSARNLRNPGWMFASFNPDVPNSGEMPYSNEITAISTDGTKARRLAQHNSVGDEYDAEPHGSPSPDGKRAIFASNWGVKDGPIAAYVAEFTS